MQHTGGPGSSGVATQFDDHQSDFTASTAPIKTASVHLKLSASKQREATHIIYSAVQKFEAGVKKWCKLKNALKNINNNCFFLSIYKMQSERTKEKSKSNQYLV